MTSKEYDEEVRELAFHFVAAPMIILLGMFIVGTLLDSFTHSTNTFSLVFIGVGGVPGVIAYYFGLLKKRGWIGASK